MELFRLLGTIAINNDEANKAINETTETAERSQSKLSNAFEKIGGAAVKVGKVVAKGVAVGASAIGTLTGFAVNSYAEYEQLIGGTELLFGEAYEFVAEKAKNAYKDVQMSQNDYLQQMNGFATGLKTALGGNEKAAAELASKIITAEADIVAATGNSQEAVQNAFNGIMKSNFTMLDNLQLGITPTKEGFQQVIDKVNEWNTANGKATAYQIDNLADCQAALVDYVEMQGLANYAANEGANTISGSVATMKAAWQNFLVGLSDGSQNMDTLVSNLFESVKTVGENLIPRVKQTLKSIWDVVRTEAPKILAEIPTMVMNILPQSVRDFMDEAYQYLLDTVFVGFQKVWESVKNLAGAFTPLIDAVKEFLAPLKDVNVQQRLNVEIAYFLEEALCKVADVINIVADVLKTVFTFLVEHKKLVESIVIVLASFATAFVTVTTAVKAFHTIIVAVKAAIAGVSAAFAFLTSPIGIAIVAIGAIIAIGVLLYKNWDTIKEKAVQLWENIKATFENIKNSIIDGISNALNFILDKFNSLPEPIRNALSVVFGFVVLYIQNIVERFRNLYEGVVSILQTLYDVFSTLFQNIFEFVSEISNKIWSKITETWENIKLSVSQKVENIVSTVKQKFQDILDGIKEKLELAKQAVSDAIEKIKGFFDFEWHLPELKLPHIKIEGEWDLKEGKFPSFGVEWYAKGAVLNKPTIFGMNGNNAMIGGEAGAEAVAPIDVLQGYVAQAVASQNAGLVESLMKILDALLGMREGMKEDFIEALESMRFELNNREFARLVKAVN